MRWEKGYTSSFYMTIIDPTTWRDRERVEIIGGSVKRESAGLRESAEIFCDAYPQGIEHWIRIWMDTKQEGADAHVPLFTGIATSPGDDIDGVVSLSTLQGYSVLKPASDVGLLRGWYAPAGANGAILIRQLLSVTPAPVQIAEGSPELTNHIIAEAKETHLTMIEKILSAINWRIRISGDGAISIEPKSSDPVATFDPLDYDVLETAITVKADWFDCPNVLMAIEDDLTAIARDNNPASLVSTINRGREVWAIEENADLARNETIEEYAARRLVELQKVQKTADYNRRFIPDIIPGDVVRLRYPKQKIDGNFRVSTQSIDLVYSATTGETVTEEK